MRFKLLITFTILSFNTIAQTLFYQNILHGGVTGSGGSTWFGAGTFNFSLQIPTGSTIKKAYLIAARDSIASDTFTVIMNGQHYTFSNSTIVTQGFVSGIQTGYYFSNSSIHVIEITNDINPIVSSYSLTLHPQSPPFIGIYSFFYLYVLYENPTLPLICTNIFLNKQDVAPISNYHLANFNPFDKSFPIGLEVGTSYFCDTIQDGSYVEVNTNPIGILGGSDATCSSWSCTSPYPNFAYYNNTLFGLADDTPDAFMHGTDATANIQNYINNNDTALDLKFIYQTLSNSNGYVLTNPIRSVILAYTTPCDTFLVHLLTEDTTVCRGQTVQLGVSGGNTSLSKPAYEWLPQKDLSCYNCPNPIFSGDSSQVYTVRIWNTDSCSKVLPVRVKVLPPPVFGQITTKNSVCGAQSGALTVNTPPQDSLFIDSLLVGVTPHVQNNLGAGQYHLYLKDSNGCVSKDTLVSINATNNTEALFTVNPQTGAAPLSVSTDNQSTHATDYLWYFLGDSTTAFAPNILFDTSGTYSVTLLAYQNNISCADTFSLTVTVYDSLQVIVPNIITANGDGQNDVFSIQVNAPCTGTLSIVNRWGNEVFAKDFTAQGKEKIKLWDGTSQGKKVDEGTYFYLFHIIDEEGASHQLKGFVRVVR